MTARRITIRTDVGDMTFTDPTWCTIEHTDDTATADIAHSGEDQRYRVPTSIGDAHVTTSVGKYEFGDADYTRPYLSVEVDLVMYPDSLEQLEETATALEEAARYVRTFAPRLAALRLDVEDGGRS